MHRGPGRWLLVAGLAATGCGLVDSSSGWSERNGVTTLDGVEVPHRRWVLLDVPSGPSALELSGATQDICLVGSTDGSSRVEVQVFSEVEGDGTVALQGGRVVVTSASGRKVGVNGARGTLGAGANLKLKLGVAPLTLAGLNGMQGVEIESGTGEIELSACETADLTIHTGTGDVHVRDTRSGDVQVNSGTGGVELAGCTVAGLQIETGTADVTLRDTRATRTRVDSGTGDVRLQGQNDLGSTSYDLGTGQVIGS